MPHLCIYSYRLFFLKLTFSLNKNADTLEGIWIYKVMAGGGVGNQSTWYLLKLLL